MTAHKDAYGSPKQNDGGVSLAPLSLEAALTGLLQVPAPDEPKRKPKKKSGA